jgi:hypothetical protein
VVITVAGRHFEFEPASLGRYRGHLYRGELRPDAADLAERLRRLGLPVAAARALAVVSSLEGGFDTIQTYDRSRFSWGFIQFAAIGGLPRLLEDIRIAEPALFERYFVAAGLDVERGRIRARHRGAQARGTAAVNHLHDDPRLWRCFLLAAHEQPIRDCQVKAAHDHYYERILEQPVALPFGTVSLGELFATDECGRALLFDRAVQRGVASTVALVRKASRRVRPRSVGDAPRLLQAALALEPQRCARWETVRRAFGA